MFLFIRWTLCCWPIYWGFVVHRVVQWPNIFLNESCTPCCWPICYCCCCCWWFDCKLDSIVPPDCCGWPWDPAGTLGPEAAAFRIQSINWTCSFFVKLSYVAQKLLLSRTVVWWSIQGHFKISHKRHLLIG